MVFESLVADLVNRYLGDFVENLDKSQLKIGIWGGDVVLNNLFIKQSALDDLDLPVKVLHGNIDKLVLKVPWKNLYSEPTVATLEGLSVVAVPNLGVKYDDEKEQKAAWEAKQKELQRIEEAKKAEAEKDKPSDPKADTFAEKLATNVIKNLQVIVSDIHVRYEDKVTNPKHPFAIGVTLKGLFFQTTDEKWKPTVIKDAVSMIHKLIQLDSLSLYWNTDAEIYTDFQRERLQNALRNNIASASNSTQYKYLFEPISSSAKLRLNTKPENDKFSIPKVLLNVIFEEIGIALTKGQYQNVMELLESFERMNLATTYRKYMRPAVPIVGNSKSWWHFAYRCNLEESVLRKKRMFSWENILKHRTMVREYKEAYKKKLGLKKVPTDLQNKLEEIEKVLSVFNITLARQSAELEVMREVVSLVSVGGWWWLLHQVSAPIATLSSVLHTPLATLTSPLHKAKKEGIKKQKESGGGWFSGWWGGGKKQTKEADNTDIGEQFQKLMTDEEKAKLYKAVGYEEAVGDPTLPIEFVAIELNLTLTALSLTLKDDVKKCNVVKVKLSDTFAKLEQRPAASAIKLCAKMDSFTVEGLPDLGGHTPVMVSSQNKEANTTYSLLDVLFETNPLDGECDTRVKVNARPLEIIYDAATVNQIAEFFKPPESVHLTQLQTAAMSKFEELKEQTATGLQYAIEQRKYTEIAVDLKPTYILVPEKGVWKENCSMLVLDLGSLKVNSKKQERMEITPSMETLSKEEVMKKAYDQFDISVAHFQLLFSSPGTDWQAARHKPDSSHHILRPMSLNVSLYKGFLEDISLPKMRVKGELPALNVFVSDKRLEEILCLVNSIPFPESAPPPAEEVIATWEAPNIAETVAQEGSAHQLVKKFVVEQDSSSDEEGLVKDRPPKVVKQLSREFVNMTEIDLQFEIKEISLTVSQFQKDSKEVPLLKVVIDCLGTSLQVRTFDLKVSAYLGGIYVQHMQFKAYEAIEKYCNGENKALYGGPLINLVNTPVTDDSTFKLLAVTYTKADKKGPEFKTLHKSTEQTVEVHFSALELLLHQEAIVSLMQFVQSLQEALEASSPKKDTPSQDSLQSAPSQLRTRRASSSSTSSFLLSSGSRSRPSRPAKPTEDIDIAVNAKLDVLAVAICNQEKLITDVKIRGLNAKVDVQKSKTNISASLKDITVYDPVPDALYPKILTFEGGEVFSINIIAYNGATQGENYSNMTCVDTSILLVTGCMKIVFLNKFVNNLLQFLDQFQTAMDKAKEASLAAAESAADAAKDFSTKATRVKLDIKLKAPVVIIPQNSMSSNTVVVDLGNIRVSNTFKLPGKYSADKVPAVLDNMTVDLTAVKMSRALMLGTEMRAECLLLEPVNIKINITRNLSVGWYHGHPAVDICGNLESFCVEMSQGDFTTVMSLLTENLQEGQPLPKPADPTEKHPADKPADQSKLPSATEATVTAEVAGTVSASKQSVSPKTQPSEIYSNLKFEFNIQSIKAVLYTGDTSLDSGQTQRDVSRSLALFEVQHIAAHGQIMSDTSMDCRVSLYRIVLEDTRPGREKGITRMIEQTHLVNKSGHSSDDRVNMIDVSFTQQPNQNKDIKMSVKGLYICVCLEYLLTVGDFFSKGMPQAPAAAPAVASSHSATEASKPAQVEATKAPASGGDLSILLTVEKPEIIVVENAMDRDTNALVLQTSVLVKMRLAPDSQTISGTVSQLQIESCVFAEEKRAASSQLILNPTDISLNLNAPNGKGHHIALMVGDIVMTISPAIIRTVTATLSALSPPPEEKSGTVAVELPGDLWAVKKLEDCNFWYIKSGEIDEATNTICGESSVDPQPTCDSPNEIVGDLNEELDSRGEQLILQVKHITVKLEGGVGRRTVPLIITEMSLHSEVKEWSSRLTLSAELALEVAYYNESLAVWEPLVEPVEDEGRHRPWEITLEVTQNELLPPVTEGDDEPDALVIPTPKMTIGVMSKDLLQTTVTKTSLDVLTKLSKAFGDAYNLVEMKEKPDEVTAPFVITNGCGKLLSIQLGNEFKMPEGASGGQVEMDIGERLLLQNSQQAEKQLSHVSVIRSTQQSQFRKIGITITDLNVKKELKLMKAETKAYNIEQKIYPKQQCQLVCTTDASYGMKTLNFSSILQIRNQLPFGLELYYKLSDDAKARCGEVSSDQLLSLPMDAVYAPPYELAFKPQDPTYCESKAAYQWRALNLPKGASTPPTGIPTVMCCPASKTGTSPLYFNVHVETEDIALEGSEDKAAKLYTIHINPCVKFQNQLPLPITYILEGGDETIIEPGEICTMLSLQPGKSSVSLKIKNYLEKEWISSKTIEEKPHELSVISFECNSGSVLDLGVHCVKTKGYNQLAVYCPYWMINKTGRTLSYKTGDDVAAVHPEDYSGIVLFSFKSKSFFGKKKPPINGEKYKEDITLNVQDDMDNVSLTGSEGSNSSPTGRKGKLRSPKKKKLDKKEDSRSLRKAVKASLKVSDSEWSDKFSLDTVGSSGTVACKLKAKTYEDNSPSKKSPKKEASSSLKKIGATLSSTALIGASVGGPTQHGVTTLNKSHKKVIIKVGVDIQLSSSGLTKIITFTPFFLLVNQAPYAIACKEVDVKDPKWWELEPGDCKPFWPIQTDKVKRMVVKVKDTDMESLPFYYTDPHTTLCKLDSKHGGINVQCECHESSVEIMFQEYKPGFASVQLVNHTSDATVSYVQQGLKDEEPFKLLPKQTILYTWQDPNQKRELLWSCGEKKNEKNELLKDDIQSFYYNADTKLYWVSFLDGMQRVLLYTEDIVVATLAQQAGELERLDQEITLSLKGVGLSLVNNLIQKEIAYMAITSSGVIWEEKKKKRFKALKVKQSAVIEDAYQKFVNEIAVGKKPSSHLKLDGKIEVDFGQTPPMMIRPRKCEIKRSFENGVWLQYRSSSHQMQFHMKIHRLQLDNQLPGAVFPTVLAPIPPPKSVAADSVPKPFTEMSIMIRKREFTNVMQFKYFKVLTQEMSVKVDQGFLNALLTLFASEELDEESQRQLLKADMAVVDKPLMEYAVQSTADEQKHFYDMLHVSPLKIHLSFSLYGAEKDKDSPVQLKSNVLNLFLESVGIVLTDVQDVVFKLAYFERKYNFYNQSQLTGEVTRHYSSQAIKQMYVLVLGLDVLGNPFGVIRGLAEGIEDLFYEPYQGAVQGPEEFAEGLALGVRSLLGHAVGGAAGAVSRITGALGKGIATLTLDDDYQKKRREQLNKRPADFKEGLARGGKGLVMGVFDGVTGIVRKPVAGAKEEGVAGFFKGVGKGLVGVVTRPTSGVVDFASGTFEGVKRVAEMSDEVRRVRPPRFLHKDGIVRPYLYKEAEGNDTLRDVEKGKFASTDQYVAHLVITKDLKNVLLVTDKRVLFASKGEIFGHWDSDWQYTWEDMKEAPTVTQKGIQILLKEKEKKSFFKSGTMGKVIPFEDKQKAQWVVKRMTEAMQKHK